MRRLIVQAGFILIGLGIAGLVWSYLLASSSDVTASHAWWEGTLQALGVGFVVGGLVDVLAISGLDAARTADDKRRAETRAIYSQLLREILRRPADAASWVTASNILESAPR